MPTDSFEETNFRNIIEFHKKELRLLHNGAIIDEIFNTNEKRKLRKLGVLYYNNTNWHITEKAMEIILE